MVFKCLKSSVVSSVSDQIYIYNIYGKNICPFHKSLKNWLILQSSVFIERHFFFFWLSWSTEIKCSSKKDIWYQIVLIGPLSVNNPWITFMPEEYLLIHRTCTWLMIWPVIKMTLCVQILGIFLKIDLGQAAIWLQPGEHHWWLDFDGFLSGQWFHPAPPPLTHTAWCSPFTLENLHDNPPWMRR